MYQVLARRWRPQDFDEVVGQPHVTRTLSNAIESGRLAHAYIFSGLRGTGKTTVARILAKCLNCEEAESTKPCGKCASCTEIANSRSMDVLEVDAASRTKVDQTRELLEVVTYAPVRDRYKVLIIDEAHMLSKASFNALLKTLEEPPPNVVFVLATTECHKILPTILSRCQVFEFRRVRTEEVSAHLRRICDAESVEVVDSALDRMARAGEGSVRDSLSVLERVLAFCGQKIAEEDVLRILGGVRAEVLVAMIGGLAARDAGAMLRTLDGILDEGQDLVSFWNEWIAALRDLLLIHAVPEPADLLTRGPEESAALRAAARGLSREDISRAFQLLADLEQPLRFSSQPRYLFESAVIRLASLGSVRPIEEVLASLGPPGSGGGGSSPPPRSSGGGSPSPRGPRPAPTRGATPPPRSAAPAPEPEGPPHPADAEPSAGAPPANRPTADAGPPPTVSTSSTGPAVAPDDFAGAFVASVSDEKPLVGSLLGRAESITVRGRIVRILFRKKHETLASPVRRAENLKLLTRHAEQIAGAGVEVRVELNASGPSPGEAADLNRGAAGGPSPANGRSHGGRSSGGSETALMKSATGEPGVKKLLREFGAQVLDIKPMKPPPDALDDGPADRPTMEESP